MRTLSRREYLKWALGAGAGLVTSGLAGRLWAQGQPAAKGAVTIVMWGGTYMEGARPLFDEFTSRTRMPVNVDLHVGGSMAVLARIKADLPVVKRDVIAGYDPVFVAMAKEGWLDEITPAKVPAMNELSPFAQFRDPATGKVVALAWTVVENVWYYRTDLVPKDLQPLVSVKQLFDPRLKHKIYIPPPISGTGAVLMSLARAKGGDEKNMEPGWQIMRELAEQGQVGGLPKADAEKYQAIATGDAWIMFGGVAQTAALAAANVPVARVKSEEFKSASFSEGFSVLKGPRLEQAYEWMRFFYTPENIGRLTKATKQPPSHPKAPVDPITSKFYLTIEEQKKYMFTPDYVYASSQLNSWVKRFETEIIPNIR